LDNLNFRMLYIDLEVNKVVVRREDIESLNQDFINDMKLSKEIKKAKEMKVWERAFGTFLMKFKTSF